MMKLIVLFILSGNHRVGKVNPSTLPQRKGGQWPKFKPNFQPHTPPASSPGPNKCRLGKQGI